MGYFKMTQDSLRALKQDAEACLPYHPWSRDEGPGLCIQLVMRQGTGHCHLLL